MCTKYNNSLSYSLPMLWFIVHYLQLNIKALSIVSGNPKLIHEKVSKIIFEHYTFFFIPENMK